MKMSRLRELQTSRPFRPYTVKMTDGQEMRVKHPEFVILHPDGRTVVLVDEETGRTHLLDARQMSDVFHDALSDPRMNPEPADAA